MNTGAPAWMPIWMFGCFVVFIILMVKKVRDRPKRHLIELCNPITPATMDLKEMVEKIESLNIPDLKNWRLEVPRGTIQRRRDGIKRELGINCISSGYDFWLCKGE